MMNIRYAVRDAGWLGADRALAWARLLAGISVVGWFVLVIATRFGSAPDPWHRALSADFVSFWTAGKLALEGSPEAAWNWAAHGAIQSASFPPDAGFAQAYYAFFYPPPFLLVCVPLAMLPYGAALLIWLGTTTAGCLAVVRKMLPTGWPASVICLAFPATFSNLGHGQNAALTTALLCAATLQLDSRPRAAGICLGAMCFKPQLALLVLPALIAARRWNTICWAAVTAAGLAFVSLSLFGAASWGAFIANASVARSVMEQGGVGYAKMVSTFAAARLLGASITWAWLFQGAALLGALGAVLSVAHRNPGGRPQGAVIAVAACLATPFILDYDLMLLAIPMAWMVAEAECNGYQPWEKAVLGSAFMLPCAARIVAMYASIPLAPLTLFALLWLVTSRALRRGRSDRRPTSVLELGEPETVPI